MFSKAQKQEIAAKIEEILLSFGHPEMPTEKPAFRLRVEGTNPMVSWADIKPNWYFADGMEIPVINPHNEMQVVLCNPPKAEDTDEALSNRIRERIMIVDQAPGGIDAELRVLLARMLVRLKRPRTPLTERAPGDPLM